MFVVTSDGVLVADGQGSPAETKGLVDAIRKVTPKPITTVVIASDHGDHTAGNASFPAGVHYIIHPTSKAILDRPAGAPNAARRVEAAGRRRTGRRQEERRRWAAKTMQILFLGRAHTGGDLAVWLPRQKILFLSEIFLNRVFPAMRSAYPSEWLKALDRAEAMNADHLHRRPRLHRNRAGVAGRNPRVPQGDRGGDRRSDAAATRAGVPVDEAVKQANWGEYASWTLASSQGPIAIRKVYEELNGQLK